MLWLTQEAPDNGLEPVMLRYDSQYAANIAQGRYTPASNIELAEVVVRCTAEVARRRVVTWQHVYGHSGQHDNEVADRGADRGAKGEISVCSMRWAAQAKRGASVSVAGPQTRPG